MICNKCKYNSAVPLGKATSKGVVKPNENGLRFLDHIKDCRVECKKCKVKTVFPHKTTTKGCELTGLNNG